MMSKRTLKEKIGWSTPTESVKALINGKEVGELQAPITKETTFGSVPIMTLGSNKNRRTYPGNILSEPLPGMPFIHEKKIDNHEQKIDLEQEQYGTRLFKLDHPIDDIIEDTLVVYRNGSSTSYDIDREKNAIVLTNGRTGTDIDLEIRYKFDRTGELRVSNVILFPREIGEYSFTDEDLHEFMPTADDTFDVDKLLQYGNEELKKFAGKRLCLEDASVREEGIVARIRILE